MNSSTSGNLRKVLCTVLLVASGLAYVACTPIKPLLTRSEAKTRRVEARKTLDEQQKTLAATLTKKPAPAIDSVATVWAKYSQAYETRLSEIGRLRQPPNTPLTTSSIVFDPFGAGVSGPRRIRANRQLWVEAVNINPFKYDVQLNSTSYSCTRTVLKVKRLR